MLGGRENFGAQFKYLILRTKSLYLNMAARTGDRLAAPSGLQLAALSALTKLMPLQHTLPRACRSSEFFSVPYSFINIQRF